MDIMKLIESRLDEIYVPGIMYRASGVTLRGLIANEATMSDLFGESILADTRAKAIGAIDEINKKYGKQTLSLGSSFSALHHIDGTPASRKRSNVQKAHDTLKLPIEQKKKTLYLPYLGIAK